MNFDSAKLVWYAISITRAWEISSLWGTRGLFMLSSHSCTWKQHLVLEYDSLVQNLQNIWGPFWYIITLILGGEFIHIRPVKRESHEKICTDKYSEFIYLREPKGNWKWKLIWTSYILSGQNFHVRNIKKTVSCHRPPDFKTNHK